MEIQQFTHDDRTEVRLKGELALSSSPELRKALLELVSSRTPYIVINLEAVPYVDSSGLATLIECMKGVNEYQGRLQLTGVNPRIWQLFELVRLDKAFEMQRGTDGPGVAEGTGG